MDINGILQSVIDRTNPCKKSLRVTLDSGSSVPKYDYELVCISNDGGENIIKGWTVIDNTTNPPVIELFLSNGSSATGYDVVPCTSNITDREKIEVCKQNGDGKWKQISFINVEDTADILGPIFINPDGLITADPGDLVNCEETKRTYISNETIQFDKNTVNTVNIPAGANHAEMEPIDGDIQYIYSSSAETKEYIQTNGQRVQDGGKFETQSIDELNKLQFVGIKTSIIGTPRLVINYFYAPNLD